jgi:uncharacterized coiled-coil protein SlyX
MATVASTGETLTKSGATPEDLSTFCTAFRATVEQTSTTLADMVQQLSESSHATRAASANVTGDALALFTDLRALAERLRILDMDAMELYAELRQKHPAANEANFDALDYAMSDLDFNTALTEAETLLQGLQS